MGLLSWEKEEHNSSFFWGGGVLSPHLEKQQSVCVCVCVRVSSALPNKLRL